MHDPVHFLGGGGIEKSGGYCLCRKNGGGVRGFAAAVVLRGGRGPIGKGRDCQEVGDDAGGVGIGHGGVEYCARKLEQQRGHPTGMKKPSVHLLREMHSPLS